MRRHAVIRDNDLGNYLEDGWLVVNMYPAVHDVHVNATYNHHTVSVVGWMVVIEKDFPDERQLRGQPL